MTRTTYRNGDPITLVETGCNGCSPCAINGHLSHEQGCPDRWRDCECGCDFFPEARHQSVCVDCNR